MYAIKAENLSRKFKDKLAVDSINLSIKEGEIYGFLGPNGAGKSTAIKMLVTLLSPTSGDALILGQSITNHPEKIRLQIGVALQEASLDPQQTGIEVLELQCGLYGLSSKDTKKRIKDLTEFVDIGEAINQRIKTYSGGMKRRLDLATALVHNPRVLFLDEPTTGLDPISRKKVWDQVEYLNKELGMTIFLTTQYLEEADALAMRVGIISDGKLVKEGTPVALKREIGNDVILIQTKKIPESDLLSKLKALEGVTEVDNLNKEINITTLNGAEIIGKVALLLERENVSLESLTMRSTTLDDVFLDATGNRLVGKEEITA